jgi:hypothetical protein
MFSDLAVTERRRLSLGGHPRVARVLKNDERRAATGTHACPLRAELHLQVVTAVLVNLVDCCCGRQPFYHTLEGGTVVRTTGTSLVVLWVLLVLHTCVVLFTSALGVAIAGKHEMPHFLREPL